MDLAGPKMRLGAAAEREVARGERVVFASGEDGADGRRARPPGPGLAEAVTVGRSEIVIGDGTPRLRVVDARPGEGTVTALVERPGQDRAAQGHLRHLRRVAGVGAGRPRPRRPRGRLRARTPTSWPSRSCAPGVDVRRLRGALGALGSEARVIAKIEKVEAYEALDEIVDVSDGVMVARGDLGVEAGVARVPLIQKDVIRRAGAQGKLTDHRHPDAGVDDLPARADPRRGDRRGQRDPRRDVGRDALRRDQRGALPGRGRGGDGRDRRRGRARRAAVARPARRRSRRRAEAVMQSAVHLAQQVGAAALVVTTVSGGAARAAAKYRPRPPVIALSEDQRVRRQLALEWGVIPGAAAAAAGLGRGAGGPDARARARRSAASRATTSWCSRTARPAPAAARPTAWPSARSPERRSARRDRLPVDEVVHHRGVHGAAVVGPRAGRCRTRCAPARRPRW